ncbi:helix-turn-helix domain-containing protein [Butyrivibrio hungatei]|uniref:AraC family transcriptional regulator n=1 Tax=Butyrivibrio hungatei TaxID=185008 RepID=A0A1D9P3K9_9FIRM|nr:AraC family transcriptional regulator [Butyrivibrio hungatei]AOZ96775.1 AraC family transcriptional regulator [Butyrivibrio hungatei]
MRSDLDLAASAKENIQHKIGTNLRMFINRLHTDFPPHWHTDIEIIWPKEAPYRVVCSNQTYDVEIDDILLICPAVLHEIFSPTPGSRIYIQADFSGIVSLKEIDKAFRLMSPALHIKKKTCPPEIYEQVCNYLNSIMELYFGSAPPIHIREGEVDDDSVVAFTELAPFGELEIYSILLQFIAFCSKNIDIFRGTDSVLVSSTYKNTISLSNVCTYISEHFAENISLESIATYAGFSKYHFERIFSEYAGMTFYQYLQQMRINYAQTLLSNPELSITDISFQSGFASSTAFTRAFKKSTGYPPSQFRMLNEAKHPLSANPFFAKANNEP